MKTKIDYYKDRLGSPIGLKNVKLPNNKGTKKNPKATAKKGK